MMPFVPLLVILPLGAAFCAVAMAQVGALKRWTGGLAIAAALANLVVSLLLFGAGDIRLFVGGWAPASTLGIELVCDGLSRLMAVTINLVALVALVFAVPYMRRFTKVWLFDSMLLLMIGAMNGVVLAGDLFNLFVFLEIAAIASYALVAFGCEAEELEAAFKYMVLGTVGSALILLGVTILYSLTGQLNMALVHSLLGKVGPGSPAVLLAAACLIGGLALKAAMVPFHAWLPDAHPSAPAPISAMLSGVLIKTAGIYAVARIVFNVLGPTAQYAAILITLGVASMVIGMLLALGQWDLKRLLAYSSISQAGYVVLAIGVAAQVAARPSPDMALAGLCLFGGLFHLFNHAVFKSLLFLSSGSIEQQTGTRDLKQMGGLARRMRVTGFCCRVGALSIAGVPPFSGFFSKLIILLALALAGQYVLCAVAAAVAVGTLVMYVKVQRYALDGPPAGLAAEAREAPTLMCAALVVLVVLCLAGGLAMVPLRQHVLGPAADALLAAGRLLSMGGAQ
jgi:multicomponent Na+:H+ antiporter subunit D